MLIFFKAQAKFTSNIEVRFWRKVRKNPEPFTQLSAVGSGSLGYFTGLLPFEDEASGDDVWAYEITKELVTKIELLSSVGVESLNFDVLEPSILNKKRTLSIAEAVEALKKKDRLKARQKEKRNHGKWILPSK